MKKIQTLCFFIEGDRIWLGVRTGGKKFGRGLLNGFGGDLELGETIGQAARREFKEESGLEILSLEKRAVIESVFKSDPDKIREVHVFWVFDCQGEPTGSEEMTVQPFFLREINDLYDRMWPGDRLWFPLFLEEKKFKGRVLYDNPKDKNIISSGFKEVKDLD
ncbi:MAG: NUDIX domain-containing protein [Candidatus Portnoybacteria bacterium]|jgi:8-oxo-dGTP diphosphatase/2-hydroxy-dATP diphosphatase|nr:NUDIX domain-containing protein [Candidatus Portnoybacteria bacterium]